MRTLVLALSCALLLAGPAAAAGSHARSRSNSDSTSQAGSNVNIDNHSYRPVPTAIAPGLAASGLSCNGSTSIGGSGSGFGISFGTTTKDFDCNTRENAKYVLAITHDVPAAKEVMCDIDQVAAAFARVGRPCARGLSGVDSRYIYRNVRGPAPGPTRSAARVVKKFDSMAECRQYARHHAGVSCRPS